MVEERSWAQGGLGDVPGADLPLGFPNAGACWRWHSVYVFFGGNGKAVTVRRRHDIRIKDSHPVDPGN